MKQDYFRGLLTKELEESNVTLTTIPYDEGCSCGGGAAFAPKKIRELSSFLPPLSMDGDLLTKIKLYDFGDVKKQKDYFAHLKREAYNRFLLNKFPVFFKKLMAPGKTPDEMTVENIIKSLSSP